MQKKEGQDSSGESVLIPKKRGVGKGKGENEGVNHKPGSPAILYSKGKLKKIS